jgi:hypothetical protein
MNGGCLGPDFITPELHRFGAGLLILTSGKFYMRRRTKNREIPLSSSVWPRGSFSDTVGEARKLSLVLLFPDSKTENVSDLSKEELESAREIRIST